MKFCVFHSFLFFFLLFFTPVLWAQTSIRLTAEAIWDGTVSLTWTDPRAADATGYNVYYRKYPDPNFIKLETMPVGMDLFHWDKEGNRGEIYSFFIQALRKGAAPWESENSNTVAVTIIQEPPSELDLKGGVIDIGYSAGLTTNFGEPSRNGLKGYNIYFSDKEDGIFVKVTPQPIANVPTYLVRNLVVGKKYYFEFTAVGWDGTESQKSKSISFRATTYEHLRKSLPVHQNK